LGPHGLEIIRRIKARIAFHAAGDTGASDAGKYGNEIRVADQLTRDCRTSDAANRPAFFYHLGDVVYNFGEYNYYYDQFCEPYRNYPAPIFAIPSNHDSFVIPGTPPGATPLSIFVRNFCATQPAVTPEAGSLHRTAMTQPGVYFALDAPVVRIIGLFSNALEDPGVISSQGRRWPGVPDFQLDFLTAQLQRIKREKYPGAVLLTVHHPPFSYSPAPRTGGTGGNHGGSPDVLREIDKICEAEGVYPHAFLSGHAHNYQRYTRIVRFGGKIYDVPFIAWGDGGHNVNRLVKAKRGQLAQEPPYDAQVNYLHRNRAVPTGGLRLKLCDDYNYGYLRVSVDNKLLRIGFHQVGRSSNPESRIDMVTVELGTHKLVPN
jgi:hypothetical protein